MKKSAYYSDLIFTFSFVYFCFLFVLRYFSVPLFLSLFVCLIPATLSAYLLSLRFKKKQKLFALKKSEEEEKSALFFYLCLISLGERQDFLLPRLSILKKEALDKKDETAPPAEKDSVLLYCGKYAFLPLFYFREIISDDVARFYPNFKTEAFPVLLCDRISDEAKSLCEKLSVEVIDGPLFYRTLKDAHSLPEEYPVKISEPIKRSRRSISFSKNNSRRFFTCGVMLLVCSLFIPYPVYYIVFGSLLLIVSVLVRIFGYR